jgi:osmoprotectant transport system ATP-binding protein
MSPIVSFEDVRYEIGGNAVLRGLSFDVIAGETLVLLGRSGSGKTTALKMVNRLVEPSTGRVVVEGVPTTEWDPIQLRRRIGYVIQDVGLFPHFTVAANVGVVPELEGWSAERTAERVNELLERVGLPAAEYRGRHPRELSGGEQQRVGVARALAADPDILLFDEPFGALDPVTRQEVQHQFLELKAGLGKTALFVTHDIREALAIGDRIGLLHDGSLEFLGEPGEFLRAGTEEALAFRACLDDGGAA